MSKEAPGAEVSGKKGNREYYDEFSKIYEKERHQGYHALLDQMELAEALPWCQGVDVLEVGCGTGLILREIAPVAKTAVGLDISRKMLAQARDRGLNVLQGSAHRLPFADESFDTVVSFKVLAHVREIQEAMDEMVRVTKPGGRLILEFYNPRSLRYLGKKVRSGMISEITSEAAVYTRWDTLASLTKLLPPGVTLEKVRGLRIFTPFAQMHKIPGLRGILARMEKGAVGGPLRHFGGFMVLHLHKSEGA